MRYFENLIIEPHQPPYQPTLWHGKRAGDSLPEKPCRRPREVLYFQGAAGPRNTPRRGLTLPPPARIVGAMQTPESASCRADLKLSLRALDKYG
jgi:hypothetical protein